MKRKKRDDSHTLQINVNCPHWLQKGMRSNLKKAKKDRVNPERAKIAKALLESTKRESEAAVLETTVKTDTEAAIQRNFQKNFFIFNCERQHQIKKFGT